MCRNQGLVLNTQCLLSAWSVKLDNRDSENREREGRKKRQFAIQPNLCSLCADSRREEGGGHVQCELLQMTVMPLNITEEFQVLPV